MHQLPLDLRRVDGPSFANFWTAENEEVWQAVRAVALGGRGPLYLWGPTGCGKTHLLAAAARLAAEEGAALCLSLDRSEPVWEAVADMPADALICVDGLDALAGNAVASHALFMLFETQAPHRRLLLAARVSPAALEVGRDDLRTRLASGPVMRMKTLTDEGKAAALIHRARERGLILDVDAARYLLTHGPRAPHALFALLDRLDIARAAGARLTIPFLRAYLRG
ncbi:MAG: HdaA/DnaA family protein [Acidiferrobacter sp.]